jgi:hypothetical protein
MKLRWDDQLGETEKPADAVRAFLDDAGGALANHRRHDELPFSPTTGERVLAWLRKRLEEKR